MWCYILPLLLLNRSLYYILSLYTHCLENYYRKKKRPIRSSVVSYQSIPAIYSYKNKEKDQRNNCIGERLTSSSTQCKYIYILLTKNVISKIVVCTAYNLISSNPIYDTQFKSVGDHSCGDGASEYGLEFARSGSLGQIRVPFIIV